MCLRSTRGRTIRPGGSSASTKHRNSFKSAGKLKERIEAFIAHFNETMAKLFRWTFTGKPLAT
jgi:hypothetical protein